MKLLVLMNPVPRARRKISSRPRRRWREILIRRALNPTRDSPNAIKQPVARFTYLSIRTPAKCSGPSDARIRQRVIGKNESD